MRVDPIRSPMSGEHVAGVEPTLSPNVQDHWNRRLNLYAGRALSDVALTLEQNGRAGRLATRGQMTSPGVVNGLEVALETDEDDSGAPQFFYRIAAGMGLAASGEDVLLRSSLRIDVRDVQVCAPPAVFPPYATGTPESAELGLVIPTAVDHQVRGLTLGALLDARVTTPPPDGTRGVRRVGILVLQPIVTEMLGNADSSDPCEHDPANFAFEDQQLVDGCRLLWYMWPDEWRALPPLDRHRRNTLAYTIFDAEREMDAEQLLPWESFGVPIALTAFNRRWEPLFVDRHSVVRTGGAPRRRSVILPRLGNEFLWQARIQQFAEHVAHEHPLSAAPERLAKLFRFLPPAGVLPRDVVDLATGRTAFLPSTYRVDAAPIPLEQLDLAMEECAALAPYDLFVPDEMQLLVPVPQVWYEPGLLTHETISPQFIETIDILVRRRGKWLRRRLEVRQRKAVIDRAIGTLEQTYPERDPESLEANEAISTNTIDSSDPQLAVPEEQFGTTMDGGDTVSTVLQQLREYLTNQTPLYDDVSTAFLSPVTGLVEPLAVLPFAAPLLDTASGGKISFNTATLQLVYGRRAVALTSTETDAVRALSTNATYLAALNTLIARFAATDTTLTFPTSLAGKVTYERSRRQLIYTAQPEPMTLDELNALLALSIDKRYRRAVNTLFTFSQPRAPVRAPLASRPHAATRAQLARVSNGTVTYDAIARQLIYVARPTPMTINMRKAIAALASGSAWQKAVRSLYVNSQRPASPTNSAALEKLPISRAVLHDTMGGRVVYDDLTQQLVFTGRTAAMSEDERRDLHRMSQGASFDAAVDALFERSQRNEVAQLDRLGLRDFISCMERRIDEANDKVDLSFTRVQTDIYRVRQLMLGNDAATRLATSPVLASIAKGDSAVATQENIRAFVTDMKASAVKVQVGRDATVFEQPSGLDATQPAAAARAVESGSARLLASASAASVMTKMVPAFRQTAAEVFTGASLAVPISALATRATALPFIRPKTDDVVGQTALIGKALNFRTVTVAERLEQPKAPEAKNAAVATKASVITDVMALGINADDLTIPGFYLYNNADTLVVDAYATSANGTQRTVPRETKYTIEEVAERRLVSQVLAGFHDLDPQDGDESAFFSAAVRALDHAVAILRVVEGRIHAYRSALDRCRTALAELLALRVRVDARLNVIGSDLAETRHDVSVARALLADETTRIAAINDRRQRIIADHVPYLAFRRPRAADLLASVPMRHLEPAQTEAPAVACMSHVVAVPRELQQMANLFRDVPVRWLTHLSPLVDRLDRIELLQQTLAHAKLRAEVMRQAQVVTIVREDRQVGIGASIQRVFGAHQDVVARERQRTAQLDLAQIVGLSWLHAAERARDMLSIGDLTDANHGRAELARLAAQEVEQIAHVAGCLHERFGAVLPVLRLAWTERLSQYDEPVNLRNLASLPRWGEVQFVDRREMQAIVDWLYDRVAADAPQAVAMMSDVVRLCLLLASHAPVSQIIAGNVHQTAAAQRGARVEVAVDLDRVRVGMQVLMYADTAHGAQVVARGVVEDLADGRAAARLVDVISPTVNFTPATRVQFLEPSAVAAAAARAFGAKR